MTPAFSLLGEMVPLVLRATALMGLTAAAALGLRAAGASAATRHSAWLFGTAALLVLPILWFLAPALPLPILPPEAAAPLLPASAPPEPIPSEAPGRPDWSPAIAAAYLFGAATLCLRLLVGRRVLGSLWRDAEPVDDRRWKDLLSHLCAELSLSRRVELRVSRGPAVPMTWGTLAPKLLLPAASRNWSPERRRLVLLHELAHVARRDSLSRSLASLACALYWFHPGAWLVARRMRLEQEHAADDRVLAAGGSAQAYALSLLHLAGGRSAGAPFAQAAAMAGLDQLERRLVSITSLARRNRAGPLFLSGGGLLAAGATLLVAAGVPVSATPTIDPLATARPETIVARGASNAAAYTSPTPRVSDEGVERSASRGDSASEPRAAETDLPARPVAPGTGVRDSAGDDGRTDGEALTDYGWELPRGDWGVRTGSAVETSRSARIVLPANPDDSQRERTGGPKWPRNIPRLVVGPAQLRSAAPGSEGPVMLSWSIEVGGK